jgi:hypothetical protein
MQDTTEAPDIFDCAVAKSITKGLRHVTRGYGDTAYLTAAWLPLKDAGMPMSVFNVALVIDYALGQMGVPQAVVDAVQRAKMQIREEMHDALLAARMVKL